MHIATRNSVNAMLIAAGLLHMCEVGKGGGVGGQVARSETLGSGCVADNGRRLSEVREATYGVERRGVGRGSSGRRGGAGERAERRPILLLLTCAGLALVIPRGKWHISNELVINIRGQKRTKTMNARIRAGCVGRKALHE